MLEKYQGKPVSSKDARDIRQLQQDFVKTALTQGLLDFKQYMNKSSSKGDRFYKSFIQHCQTIAIDPVDTLEPDAYHKAHLELYSFCYTQHYPDTLRLFFEFLLGLNRFAMGIMLSIAYLKHLDTKLEHFQQPKSLTPETFWVWLHTVSKIGETTIDLIMKHDKNALEHFWGNIKNFFNQRPKYQKLAKHLVSIQYIPSQKIEMLGIAQTLHWNGLGGTGELLKSFTELKPLLPHALGYHQHQSTGKGFNKRLEPFKNQLNCLKKHTTQLICYVANQLFPNAKPFHIIDFCSGPACAAVMPACEVLAKQGHTLSVSASDVDGFSLNAILKRQSDLLNEKSKNINIDQVCYIDLTQTQNLPQLSSTYHIVCASLGLHQTPESKIANILRYFASLVIEGGLILIPDVAEQGYAQVFFAPANIVDREGYFPGLNQLNFTQVKLDIASNEGYVRIPYPIISTFKTYPYTDLPMYSLSAFIAVDIPQNKLELLQTYWLQKNHKAADQLVTQYSEKFSKIGQSIQ